MAGGFVQPCNVQVSIVKLAEITARGNIWMKLATVASESCGSFSRVWLVESINYPFPVLYEG